MSTGMTRDDGVSLIEALVSIALVSVVLTAVTSFFVGTVSATGQQRGKQIAVQVADSAMERVRALRGSSVKDGRIQGNAVDPVPAAAALLADTREWNQQATGATPVLTVVPTSDTVAGTEFRTRYYVGECALPAHGAPGARAADVDHCTTAVINAADAVRMFRVVAAVTWRDKYCPGERCVFVTSTLVSTQSVEPIFNLNDTAPDPVVENPTTRTSRVISPIDTQTVLDDVIGAYGGVPPLTITGTGVPPGVTLAANGRVSGTPTTACTCQVTLRVVDSRGRTGTTTFVWTVLSTPKLTPPGNQTTAVDTAVALPLINTGPGEGTLTWILTGTPPAGITFDAATGTFTGTPTAVSSAVSLTVRVTDSRQKFSEVQFTWRVAAWSVAAVPAKTSPRGSAISPVALTTVGGQAPFTWTVTGLPPGLTANTRTGQITGTPTTAGTNVVTVAVRDGRPETTSTQFSWTVTG